MTCSLMFLIMPPPPGPKCHFYHYTEAQQAVTVRQSWNVNSDSVIAALTLSSLDCASVSDDCIFLLVVEHLK